MQLAIIGCGYVGLVTGTCMAELGNKIICVDSNEERINQLNKNIMPIYEPGLSELVKTNIQGGRLSFTTYLKKAVENSEIIFIAVGTPLKDDGSPDISQVEQAGKQISEYINSYKIVVVRSTVPVGVTHKLKILMSIFSKHEFDIANNPEFLKEGTAIDDFIKPDRIILGVESGKARQKLLELYEPFGKIGRDIYTMDIKSSEMTKYAANAMLSTKISFINEIANLCEYYDADINQVCKGICSDSRIGQSFLNPGIGYSGSCLPKDICTLIHMAKKKNYTANMLESVHRTNEYQKQLLITKIKQFYNANLANVVLAVWGLSFKPETDDIRNASSLALLDDLLACDATINVHDPQAITNIRKVYGDKLIYCSDPYAALENADGLCVLTEWDMYRNVDFDRIKALMKQSVIFDGRNVYSTEQIEKHRFTYFGVGRKPINFEKQVPAATQQAVIDELI